MLQISMKIVHFAINRVKNLKNRGKLPKKPEKLQHAIVFILQPLYYHDMTKKPLDVIPVQLDKLSVPISLVPIVAKDLVDVKYLMDDIIDTYQKTKVLDRNFTSLGKLQIELVRMYKELTGDVQKTFQSSLADALVDFARNHPDVQKEVSESAARDYLAKRGKKNV